MKMKKPTYDELNRGIVSLTEQLRREKQLMQTLRESEDIYKTIWDRSLAGIYVSQGGKFQIVSPIAVSFTGYSLDELIGKKSNSIIYPDDQERVKRDATAMLSGEHAAPYEFRIMTKQGKICLLYTSDAADDLLCVDLGGRRIIKKKKKKNKIN